ncbi:hypothetical protein SODG_004560 [Sodalis praecaptivus]
MHKTGNRVVGMLVVGLLVSSISARADDETPTPVPAQDTTGQSTQQAAGDSQQPITPPMPTPRNLRVRTMPPQTAAAMAQAPRPHRAAVPMRRAPHPAAAPMRQTLRPRQTATVTTPPRKAIPAALRPLATATTTMQPLAETAKSRPQQVRPRAAPMGLLRQTSVRQPKSSGG